MSKINTIGNQGGEARNGGSFFYEDWLMKELQDDRRKAFVPNTRLEENGHEYRLTFRVQNLRKEDCSIKVEFPFLYISIQQREGGLLALLSRHPVIHIFARHFLIPYDVDTEKLSYAYKASKLTIHLPKYYSEEGQ